MLFLCLLLMQPHCTLWVFFSLLMHFGAIHIIINSFFKDDGITLYRILFVFYKTFLCIQRIATGDHKLRKIWRQIIKLKTNVPGNDVIHFFFWQQHRRDEGAASAG